MSTQLRIASWNIHGGVGLDACFSPERIARVLGELDADIVAVQEFGSRGAFDMRAHLERAGGARAIVMPTFRKRGNDFGNVVLSRWPVRDVACHALGLPGREPRNAIDLVVEHGGGTLRVVATHLGLRTAERRAQVARLCALLDAPIAQATILLGDFNEWRSRAIAELDHRLGAQATPATFPSPCPIVALDRLWVAPAEACIALGVHRSRTARLASDHLPLVATLRLP